MDLLLSLVSVTIYSCVPSPPPPAEAKPGVREAVQATAGQEQAAE